MQQDPNLNFTSTKSFQLFAQGLESLQSYEKTAARASLNAAEQNFQQCIDQFPGDVLPRFYYGVVKTLRGYPGLDEAIKQFNLILQGSSDELKPEATYNLAIAHIEKYKHSDSEIAKQLLEDTRKQLATRAPDPKRESLRLQSHILELYLIVQDSLWEHRNDLNPPAQKVIDDARTALESFWVDYQSTKILEASRRDIVADYNNTCGTYWESVASFSKGDERKKLSLAAKRFFEQSLEAKNNWLPAKSNLARVYQDLLNDGETAKRLWHEVLETRPGDEYAHYNLARLAEQQGDKLRAMGLYKKAPDISEAVLALAGLYVETGQPEKAQESIQKLLGTDDLQTNIIESANKLLARIQTARKGPTHA